MALKGSIELQTMNGIFVDTQLVRFKINMSRQSPRSRGCVVQFVDVFDAGTSWGGIINDFDLRIR